MLFAWLVEQGFAALDDSDPCVFTRTHPDGEIITIGVYVDTVLCRALLGLTQAEVYCAFFL
jgi:hypothetical protein